MQSRARPSPPPPPTPRASQLRSGRCSWASRRRRLRTASCPCACQRSCLRVRPARLGAFAWEGLAGKERVEEAV
eukprot:354321-Chlamydomonas_euryale.AAC.5